MPGSGARSLLRGSRALLGWTSRCRSAAHTSTFFRGLVVHRLTSPRTTGLLGAARHFIHRGPCAAFGFTVRNPAPFVAFFDVLCLPFLLVGIFRFIAAWHDYFLLTLSLLTCKCGRIACR